MCRAFATQCFLLLRNGAVKLQLVASLCALPQLIVRCGLHERGSRHAQQKHGSGTLPPVSGHQSVLKAAHTGVKKSTEATRVAGTMPGSSLPQVGMYGKNPAPASSQVTVSVCVPWQVMCTMHPASLDPYKAGVSTPCRPTGHQFCVHVMKPAARHSSVTHAVRCCTSCSCINLATSPSSLLTSVVLKCNATSKCLIVPMGNRPCGV